MMNHRHRIAVDLVFDDWRADGEADSIYNTALGLELSSGDLHSGTVFQATLLIPEDLSLELAQAWSRHRAYPVFRVLPQRRTGGAQ